MQENVFFFAGISRRIKDEDIAAAATTTTKTIKQSLNR